MTYRRLFEAAYAYLWKHYRAEYVYKNTVVRKILMGRHSLATTRVFSEFRLGDAKADLLMVNGTTTVYEIKTALDSLDRLPTQLATYCSAVEYVNVVTHPCAVDRVMQIADRHVGVIVLTERGRLSVMRLAKSNQKQLDPGVVFDSLRREEYVSAIVNAFGNVPDLPNTAIHAACKRLFSSLGPREAHGIFAAALHERGPSRTVMDIARRAPQALKALCLTMGLSDRDAVRFEHNLDRQVLANEA